MLRGILTLLSITSLLATAAHVHAQGYPSGAVNLVIPLAPGTPPTSPPDDGRRARNCSRCRLFP
jgi:hypothetical protein